MHAQEVDVCNRVELTFSRVTEDSQIGEQGEECLYNLLMSVQGLCQD